MPVFRVVFLTFLLVVQKLVCERELIGLEDFTEIRQSDTFVDKTEMIKLIFDRRSMLITAPRHFGKSVNFDMVSLFLRNDQNKSEIQEIFKGTNIFSDRDFITNHMTNHPVLYCNFDTGFEVTCEESLKVYYRQILFGVFIEHDYLKDSPVLNEDERKTFSTYIEKNDELETPEILQGLQFIINSLYLHHDKKVIVLIDEYDANIVNDLFNTENTNYTDNIYLLEEIMNFQINLFSRTFENSHQILQALVTGTLPIEFLNESCQLTIDPVAFMTDKDLTQFYGFTMREVKSLVKKFKLSYEQSEELLKWYNGYSSPKSTNRIFNPFTVTKFLELKLAFGYWIQTFPLRTIMSTLMDNVIVQDRMVKLVNSEPVSISLKKILSLADLKNLKRIINKQWEDDTDVDVFYQFLLQVGYLTFEKPLKYLPKSTVVLRVPNKEVRDEFSSIIKKYFSHRLEGD